MTALRTAFVVSAVCLGLAGCATTPSPTATAAAEPGAPFRAQSKREAPKDGKKRDRAAISAQYHLDLEAVSYTHLTLPTSDLV